MAQLDWAATVGKSFAGYLQKSLFFQIRTGKLLLRKTTIWLNNKPRLNQRLACLTAP